MHFVQVVAIYLFIIFPFFKRFYLFIFRERREGERKVEKHQCMVTSNTRPTGDLAHNPGMCPDWELNLWPFRSQAGTQSTDPHQPGQLLIIFSYNPLYFFSVSCYFSSFIWFYYLGPLSLSLISLVKCQSFFIFLNNQLLGSLIFCIIFLDSISFISVLIFIFPFFSLWAFFFLKIF